jgi:hypothetical protein
MLGMHLMTCFLRVLLRFLSHSSMFACMPTVSMMALIWMGLLWSWMIIWLWVVLLVFIFIVLIWVIVWIWMLFTRMLRMLQLIWVIYVIQSVILFIVLTTLATWVWFIMMSALLMHFFLFGSMSVGCNVSLILWPLICQVWFLWAISLWSITLILWVIIPSMSLGNCFLVIQMLCLRFNSSWWLLMWELAIISLNSSLLLLSLECALVLTVFVLCWGLNTE